MKYFNVFLVELSSRFSLNNFPFYHPRLPRSTRKHHDDSSRKQESSMRWSDKFRFLEKLGQTLMKFSLFPSFAGAFLEFLAAHNLPERKTCELLSLTREPNFPFVFRASNKLSVGERRWRRKKKVETSPLASVWNNFQHFFSLFSSVARRTRRQKTDSAY